MFITQQTTYEVERSKNVAQTSFVVCNNIGQGNLVGEDWALSAESAPDIRSFLFPREPQWTAKATPYYAKGR